MLRRALIMKTGSRDLSPFSCPPHHTFEPVQIEWHPANRVWSADLDNGIVHLELDTLRVVKDTFWRFAEYGVTSTSIYRLPC